MTSIKLKSHVGSDGVLTLQVPVGIKDADLEVMVIVQPTPKPEELGWPPGFFEKTFGSIPDFPEIESEGDYKVPEKLG